MGCKNCNGVISQSTQLPPGCDSILSITTDVTGTGDTVVTITFCSGATQQFTIPSGQDGQNGSDGANGANGSDGSGVQDVTAEQDGNDVTLTIILENGEETTITFTIPSASGAYVVQHNSQGIDAPELTGEFATKELSNIAGYFSVIKGTIPGGTIVNPGDTIHWDAVFNITGSVSQIHNVFKALFLCVGSTDTIDDKHVNLTGSPALIYIYPDTTVSVHVNVEMSRTNSPLRSEVFLKGSMHVLDKGEHIHYSSLTSDPVSPQTDIETVAFYHKCNFVFTDENYIQLIGSAGGFGPDTVNIDPIYMTVTKIPKI